MSSKAPNSKATTKQQYQVMLDFMKENGDLSAALSGRAHTRLLWCKLTEQLNKCDGAPKHYKSWVKVWSDWKGRVKKKALTMQFDDGKSSALTLTECQLIVFMGYNIDVKDGTAEAGAEDIKALFPHNPKEIEEVTVKPESDEPETYTLNNVNNEYNQEESLVEDEEEETYTNYEALEQTDGELETIEEPPVKRQKHQKVPPKLKKKTPEEQQTSNSSLRSIVDKFADLESRRIELELLREQNESRRISAQIQSNANQQQFTEFMHFMKGAITSFLTTYCSQTLSNGQSKN